MTYSQAVDMAERFGGCVVIRYPRCRRYYAARRDNPGAWNHSGVIEYYHTF